MRGRNLKGLLMLGRNPAAVSMAVILGVLGTIATPMASLADLATGNPHFALGSQYLAVSQQAWPRYSHILPSADYGDPESNPEPNDTPDGSDPHLPTPEQTTPPVDPPEVTDPMSPSETPPKDLSPTDPAPQEPLPPADKPSTETGEAGKGTGKTQSETPGHKTNSANGSDTGEQESQATNQTQTETEGQQSAKSELVTGNGANKNPVAPETDSSITETTAKAEKLIDSDLTALAALSELDLASAVVNVARIPGSGVHRWSGESRYQTAVRIAEASGLRAATSAFVATGVDFPDALAAAAAAGSRSAPILLVGKTNADAQPAINFLQSMPNLTNVYVIGGSAAVSHQLLDTIKNHLPKSTVTRIKGDSRFETAAEIAQRFFKNATEVFVATGSNFPDALTAAAAAGRLNAPVLLTGADISDYLANYLTSLPGPVRVHLVGGPAVVPDSIITQIKALPGKYSFQRHWGSDRYLTSKAVANDFNQDQNPSLVYLATGLGYADALAGAPVAALTGAPVLLTNKSYLPVPTRDYLRGKQKITSAVFLGGSSAVSNEITQLVTAIVNHRSSYVHVTGLSLRPDTISAVKGTAQQVTAAIAPTNATFKNLLWTSSNTQIATVSPTGLVTIVGVGSATITATTVDGGYSFSTKVTGTSPIVCKDVPVDTGGQISTCSVGEVTAKIEGRLSLSGSGSGYQVKFMTNGSGIPGGAVSFGMQYDTQSVGGAACSGQVCLVSENVNPPSGRYTYRAWGPISGNPNIALTLHDASDTILFWVDGNPVGAARGQTIKDRGFNFLGEVNTKHSGDSVTASITNMQRYERNPTIWVSGCYSNEYLPGTPNFSDDGRGILNISWSNFRGQTPGGLDWDSAVTANRAGWCGS